MKTIFFTVIAIPLAVVHVAYAQEIEFPKPTAEHAFLKKFVGDWATTSYSVASPDQPKMKCEGKMKSRMVGGFWVVTETEASFPGMKFTAVQTIGYDEESKKYVGTWIDSMVNHMWKYEGTEKGDTLTLEATGPNFMAAGEKSQFRDVYEFVSDDDIKVTSLMQAEDGSWNTFMTGTATRIKP